MATWQNAVVTQRGLNLQAKLETGSTLMLTKAVSSTNYVNPATLDRMTEIPNQKQTLIMNDVVPIDGGRAIFGVMLTNINLTESYILNQIGVFARDPDLGEILYFVAQAEEPDTIPSAAALPDFSITYSFNMIIANAGIISAAIDPLALATKDDILALRAKDKQQDDSLSTIDADILALQEKDKQHDTELSNKASTNTVYTKQQTDASLAKKANADAVYTKQQTDTALAKKVAIALSLDAAISAGTAIAVKDSSGNVSISLIDISRKDNAAFTGDGTLIATLPEGFRPMGSWRYYNGS